MKKTHYNDKYGEVKQVEMLENDEWWEWDLAN